MYHNHYKLLCIVSRFVCALWPVQVDFGELFTFTSVKKVIYIVASLLWERRVILTSKKLR